MKSKKQTGTITLDVLSRADVDAHFMDVFSAYEGIRKLESETRNKQTRKQLNHIRIMLDHGLSNLTTLGLHAEKYRKEMNRRLDKSLGE